jgi:hypothetical protein
MGRLAANCFQNASIAAHAARQRRGALTEKPAICGGFLRALCRTRTGDPFLTMEVLYQLS